MRTLGLYSAGVMLLFLITVQVVYSALPTVSGVSGTVSEGQTITVTGANFGATGPNILVFDNFESGTIGDVINTGAGSATVGEWDYVWGAQTKKPRYYSGGAHSGSKSFRADMALHWNELVGAGFPSPGTKDVFMSYWFKLPDGDTFPGASSSPNWKVAWVMGNGSGSNALTMPTGLGGYGGDWVIACNGCGPLSNGNIWMGNLGWEQGDWNYTSFYLRAAQDNSGRIDFWSIDKSSGVFSRVGEDRQTIANSTIPANDFYKEVHVNGYGREEASILFLVGISHGHQAAINNSSC